MQTKTDKQSPTNNKTPKMEHLKLLQQCDQTKYGRKFFEAQLRHQEAMFKLNQKQEELVIKSSETNLLMMRENLRPSTREGTTVHYDPVESKYVCQYRSFDDETEEIRSIFAYGDSPSQAQDNFDHLWIFGEETC